jgi:hypothetical protein
MPDELTQRLLTNLQKHANPKTKTWWEIYVKVGHFGMVQNCTFAPLQLNEQTIL